MLFAAVLVHALHAALEDREIAFDRVRVDFTATVFARRVMHRAMIGEVHADFLILASLVRHNAGLARHVFEDHRPNGRDLGVFHHERAGLSLSANEGTNRMFVAETTALGLVLFVADVGFVNLNDTALTAHRGQTAGTHGFADTVGQESGRLVGDIQNAVQLVRAKALFARREQGDRLQHLVQRNKRGLEHRAYLDRKRLAAGVALANADTGALTLQNADPLGLAVSAMGANRAVWSQDALKVGIGCGFFVKVGGGKDGHDTLVLKCQNPTYSRLVRQVYCRLFFCVLFSRFTSLPNEAGSMHQPRPVVGFQPGSGLRIVSAETAFGDIR